MKVTVIANISANGRLLIADNPNIRNGRIQDRSKSRRSFRIYVFKRCTGNLRWWWNSCFQRIHRQGFGNGYFFNINPLITGVGGILGNNSELNSKFQHKVQTLKDRFLQLHLTKQE